ncbi:MAG: hypothetical protein ACRERC_13425, partial [Candidatus Binatia bacterium]
MGALSPRGVRMAISAAATRQFLRKELEAHLDELGYTFPRDINRVGAPLAEIARVSPVRGRLVYAETIVRTDLASKRCHDRLLFFSQRRTRRRSQILFFIGVEEAHRPALEELLVKLGIRGAVRGGNVQVVAFTAPKAGAGAGGGADAPRRGQGTTKR